MIAAIFFPADPEARVFDLVQQANAAMRAGLRLYTNGRQLALLPKPVNGWAPFGSRTVPPLPKVPQCRA